MMAEPKGSSHVVEIPVAVVVVEDEVNRMSSRMEQHPMMEISQSPGHLLLLKLWQREEDLFARRMSIKETRLDSIKREIFTLCSIFLLFHAFFSIILFISSSSASASASDISGKCRKWWIPSLLSLVPSMAVALLAQLKLHKYWKVAMRLKREAGDNRALTRCTQELRMKGASFDLSKEPQIKGKMRMKSSSVEIKWKPVTWCSHYLVTLCIVVFAGLAFPAPKLFLCIF